MGRIEGGTEGEVQGAGGSRKWYKAYKNSRAGGVPDRPEDLKEQWRSQMSGLRERSKSRTAKGWGPEPAGAGERGEAAAATAGAWPAGGELGGEPEQGRGGDPGPKGRGGVEGAAGGAARVGVSGPGPTPPGLGQGAHEQEHTARRRQASGAQGRAHVTGQMNDLKDVAEDRGEAAEAREGGRRGGGGHRRLAREPPAAARAPAARPNVTRGRDRHAPTHTTSRSIITFF